MPVLATITGLIPLFKIVADFISSFRAANNDRYPTDEEIAAAVVATEDARARWALALAHKRALVSHAAIAGAEAIMNANGPAVETPPNNAAANHG